VSAEDYKAIGQGTVAQFGTWSVNEADKTLTQHVESSFTRKNEGNDAKLTVNLTGDELKLVTANGATFSLKKSPNPPQTLRQQLVGTWNLVSCDRADLSVCANPSGSISFGASGRYTVFFAPKGRAKVASAGNGRANVTPEDYKTAAQGVVAGVGTWSVNEADKTITYKVEDALFPGTGGAELKGTIVSLTGDDMKHSGPTLGKRYVSSIQITLEI
jgi:hypothetical protein